MMTIYGPDNRPITPQKDELAFGQGRATIAEQFPDFQNPDEIARSKGLAYYDEIAKDPHVASVFQTRILAVLGCPREIRPATDKRADRKIADFATKNLQEILKPRGGLDAIAEQILRSSLKNGFGVQEILWNPKHPDGVVVEDVRDRDPDRFILTPDGDFLKAHAFDTSGERMPERKFIVSTYQPEYENRYGTSLFVSIHWYVWFKKNGLKFWLVFLEKFGQPTVLGEYPRDATLAEQDKLADALDSIQTRTSISIPEGFKASLLEAARAGATDGYRQLLEVCDQQISKAILGQTLTTQEGKDSGSYALGKVHNDVRGDILIADGKWLDRIINWTLLTWLIDYNFEVAAYPYIVTQTMPGTDLKTEAEIDEKLVNMGVRLPQSYFYAKYNRPEPKENEPVVSPTPQTPLVETPRRGVSTERAAAFSETPPNERVAPTDALFASVKKAGAKVYQDTFVLPLKRLVATANDFDAVDEALNGLEHGADDFSALLADALTTAQILGRWVMQQRTSRLRSMPDSRSLSEAEKAATFAEGDREDEPFLDVEILLDSLTPEQAAQFVAEKGVMGAEAYKRLSDEAKRTAFTIANVEDKRVIALVKQELESAIREGKTYEEFREAVDQVFDTYGVTEFADAHLETLFRTNVQSAYNQGAWDILHDADVKDMIQYLIYDAIEDPRTCGLCAALDGTTLPMDDPFWSIYWPPNHHRCRCDVRPVTTAAAKRDGVTARTAPKTYDITLKNGTTKTLDVTPADGFKSAPTMGGIQ